MLQLILLTSFILSYLANAFGIIGFGKSVSLSNQPASRPSAKSPTKEFVNNSPAKVILELTLTGYKYVP